MGFGNNLVGNTELPRFYIPVCRIHTTIQLHKVLLSTAFQQVSVKIRYNKPRKLNREK